MTETADKELELPKPEPTKRQLLLAKVQLTTLCWTLFLIGWNDGTLGPLLPRIQQVYHVGYTIVSLLFVFQCVGSLGGALINIVFTQKHGFGKLMILGYSFTFGNSSDNNIYVQDPVCKSWLTLSRLPLFPFPVFVFSCVINGVGLSIQDAQGNGYVASFSDNSGVKMGLLQASYGVGALVAPLVSTQFAQLRHWSFHYLISVGISTLNTVFLIVVFRGKTQDECMAQIGQAQREKGTSEESHLRQIISMKSVHLMALFLLVHAGILVTIGGWIVTFMINVRGGGTSAGYISAGFFGGIALGRIILLPLNKKIGERRVVYLYGVLAIGFELIIWLVPSLVAGAISVSVVGLLMGPVWPIAMSHAGRIFPPWLLAGAIGWIAGIAIAGTAIFPFITGAVASETGIKGLEPLLVGMLGLLLVLWAIIPSQRV